MRVRAGSIIGVTVEINGVTFENRLADETVVWLVDGEDERGDGVTSVGSLRRVAIRTRHREIQSDERIGCTLADSSMDRILDRFNDIELNTPEERLFVDHSLVMIQAGSL